MRITKDTRIAGVPATDLRRVFREVRRRTYLRLDDLRADVGAGLGISKARGKALVAQLIEEGYIARSDREYGLTEQGLRLAAASTGAPIPRAKAEALLTAFIERARSINQGDSWYRVARIELFGSLLEPARDLVNDIDLMVTLAQRYELTKAQDYAQAMRVYYCARTGKGGAPLMAFLAFPTEEVLKQLKAGSRAYQLLDERNHDEMRRRTACEVVFADDAPTVPLPAHLQE